MAKLYKKSELPHYHSTRDTRDRLDLVKPEGPMAGKYISADRIIYHPGDTCAARERWAWLRSNWWRCTDAFWRVGWSGYFSENYVDIGNNIHDRVIYIVYTWRKAEC